MSRFLMLSDARTMVDAIIYPHRRGIAWQDLPEVHGPGGPSGRHDPEDEKTPAHQGAPFHLRVGENKAPGEP